MFFSPGTRRVLALCLFAGFAAATARADSGSPVVRFLYRLRPGDHYRYSVSAFFSGHIPRLVDPSGPPVNLKIDLTYVATVKSVTRNDADVEFSVDRADIYLLEKDPGPGGKVASDQETPLPLPLSQIQKALNVSATVRPDGSVAVVKGGPGVPSMDFGFDLRKLFLVTMPVSFPKTSIRLADTWHFDDGLLGHNPGRTQYSATLTAAKQASSAVEVIVDEHGLSNVMEYRDKDDHPTQNQAQSVITVTGTVDLNGKLTFGAVSGGANDISGRLRHGTLTLHVDLMQKRAVPDPDNPTAPLDYHIDVHGRLFVAAEAPRGTTQPGGGHKQ